MSVLNEYILAVASEMGAGALLAPKEFLHLGSRAAVDQSLSRLVKEGSLMRVKRGLYVAPVTGRFGTRPPSLENVIESLSEKTGEIIVPHGAAAANALGLTTQVPVREVFLTSGRSRALTFGSRTVTLKHAPPWQLLLGNREAGAAIRALVSLGEERVEAALVELKERLPNEEWIALTKVRSSLPSWMAQAIGAAMMGMTKPKAKNENKHVYDRRMRPKLKNEMLKGRMHG